MQKNKLSKNKPDMDTTQNFAWLGWLLSAIVLLLVFGMGVILQNPVRLLLTGKMTQGIVVGIETDEKLQSPIVQFTTFTGEQVKVTGREFSDFNSSKIGDRVRVAYNPAKPHDAQLLLWSQSGLVGAFFLAGFITFILLLWISGILIAPEINMGDPLHILTTAIAYLKLSPTRFPLYFILPLAIFSCGLGTYVHYTTLHELLTKGIKVTGYVNGSTSGSSQLSDGSRVSGEFNTIEYTDLLGETHQIRQSTAKPYTSLKDGDEVQVIYPPSNPKSGVLNTGMELYPPFVFFLFCFCAFTSLAVLLLRGIIRV